MYEKLDSHLEFEFSGQSYGNGNMPRRYDKDILRRWWYSRGKERKKKEQIKGQEKVQIKTKSKRCCKLKIDAWDAWDAVSC